MIWVTGGLVAARVDDLEVVDEPVRLLEVAIAVEVVPVPLVERLEIVRGLRNFLPEASWPWTQNAMASRIRNQVLLQTMLLQKSRP